MKLRTSFSTVDIVDLACDKAISSYCNVVNVTTTSLGCFFTSSLELCAIMYSIDRQCCNKEINKFSAIML